MVLEGKLQESESDTFTLQPGTYRSSSIRTPRVESGAGTDNEKVAGLGDTIMTFSRPLSSIRKSKRSNVIKRDKR